MTDYRMELNNYLQWAFRHQSALTWTTRQLGPEHKGAWEAVAHINHVACGTGIARLLDDAKEEAARLALIFHRGY